MKVHHITWIINYRIHLASPVYTIRVSTYDISPLSSVKIAVSKVCVTTAPHSVLWSDRCHHICPHVWLCAHFLQSQPLKQTGWVWGARWAIAIYGNAWKSALLVKVSKPTRYASKQWCWHTSMIAVRKSCNTNVRQLMIFFKSLLSVSNTIVKSRWQPQS